MKYKGKIIFVFLLGFLILLPISDAWEYSRTTVYGPSDMSTGYPQICSDGAGGAIIVWHDMRNFYKDIFAQRINGEGVPLWQLNGTGICNETGIQEKPQIVSDGAGGAIIAWEDDRDGSKNIYAQRINSLGNPLWTLNGTRICNETGDQYKLQLCGDGAGGAIITWVDERGADPHIYAQYINASEAILWDDNGIPISTAEENQYNPQICSDGVGGAIITWRNYDLPDIHIYAQRVNKSGAALWDPNGTAVCTLDDNWNPQLCSDGKEGAIITWEREGEYVYAQRLNGSGAYLWDPNGTQVSSAPGVHFTPQICTDGAEGAIIVFQNDEGIVEDIFIQRMDADGVKQWGANGTNLCHLTGGSELPQIVSDGAGGAYATWVASVIQIRVEHIDSTSAVRWGNEGAVIFGGWGYEPQICYNGSAIVTYFCWATPLSTIFAQVCAEEAGAGGIPGFTLMMLVLGLMAIIYLYHRRTGRRSTGFYTKIK